MCLPQMCAVMTLHPTSPNAPKINPMYFVPGIKIRNKPNTMALNASKRGAASWSTKHHSIGVQQLNSFCVSDLSRKSIYSPRHPPFNCDVSVFFLLLQTILAHTISDLVVSFMLHEMLTLSIVSSAFEVARTSFSSDIIP